MADIKKRRMDSNTCTGFYGLCRYFFQNIIVDVKLLESSGHKFVRYADDYNIYVKTELAAKLVMVSSVRCLGEH